MIERLLAEPIPNPAGSSRIESLEITLEIPQKEGPLLAMLRSAHKVRMSFAP
jgi:hypothetical protein